MSKLIHTMIRVLDEARSVAFYDQAFGLRVADRLPFDAFTLVYLNNPASDSAFELELTINTGRTEPYNIGDGYGHLALSVADLEAAHSRLTADGLAPRNIVEFAPASHVIAKFFFISDPDGYQIEVLERGGRYH